MTRGVLIALNLALIGAILVLVLVFKDQSPTTGSNGNPSPGASAMGQNGPLVAADGSNRTAQTSHAPPVDWTDPASCQRCHPVIYEEWSRSMHAIAWTDPHFQTVLSRAGIGGSHQTTECNSCHTPKPLFERQPGEAVLAREERLETGVDCLSCHRHGESVVGSLAPTETPCNAIADAALSTPEFCGECHRAVDRSRSIHEYEEWLQRSELTRDETCISCHMVETERPLAVGGASKVGHSHLALVSQDPEILRSAFRIEAQINENEIDVVVINTGTGHRLPTGRMRTLILTVAVRDASGEIAAEYREVFSKPATPGAGESTQLLDGERRTLQFPLAGLTRGEVELAVLFKAMRYDLEDQIEPLFRQTMAFGDGVR